MLILKGRFYEFHKERIVSRPGAPLASRPGFEIGPIFHWPWRSVESERARMSTRWHEKTRNSWRYRSGTYARRITCHIAHQASGRLLATMCTTGTFIPAVFTPTIPGALVTCSTVNAAKDSIEARRRISDPRDDRSEA